MANKKINEDLNAERERLIAERQQKIEAIRTEYFEKLKPIREALREALKKNQK